MIRTLTLSIPFCFTKKNCSFTETCNYAFIKHQLGPYSNQCVLHIRVTCNHFKLTTIFENYAAYTPIDRFACSAVHLSFLQTARGALFPAIQKFTMRAALFFTLPVPFFLPVFFFLALFFYLSFPRDQSVRIHRTGEMIERLNM